MESGVCVTRGGRLTWKRRGFEKGEERERVVVKGKRET